MAKAKMVFFTEQTTIINLSNDYFYLLLYTPGYLHKDQHLHTVTAIRLEN